MLVSAVLLSGACIEGMDRPGDAKLISFPDLTVDGRWPWDGEAPDMRVDRPSVDVTLDIRPLDGSVDRLPGDGTVDRLAADRSVDTLSPDGSVDTLSPDSSVDLSVDAPTSDTATDAPWADGASTASCASAADRGTVMLLTFEGSGSTVTDVAGAHDGELINPSRAARAPGAVGCGDALEFNPSTSFAHVEVADSADWVIGTGSVDFWLRPHATPSWLAGIMGREDWASEAGEFVIAQFCNNSIIVRIQSASGGHRVCSDPISNDAWHHVGVNFGAGGLELFVDGQRATRTQSIVCGGLSFDCGETTTQGLTARSNPWVIGARTGGSEPGSATPVSDPFEGAIDSVRISTIRRVF